MNIHEIKERTKDTAPYFFSPDTLKFFGQTMAKFSVKKLSETQYIISAPMKDHTGKKVGTTQRIFNTETNKLETIKTT